MQAWARLMRAQKRALASVEDALKAADLPPLAWYDMLLETERAGDAGLRLFELGRAMLLEPYNLTRLVDRLERAGYVERRACPEDGRGQVIVATEAGKVIRRRMWPVYEAAIEAAVGARLTPGQTAALADLLALLSDGRADV